MFVSAALTPFKSMHTCIVKMDTLKNTRLVNYLPVRFSRLSIVLAL